MPPSGLFSQELRDRRIRAERLQQLDLRVRQFDERHRHAMLGHRVGGIETRAPRLSR
jgi:hypothetical protein